MGTKKLLCLMAVLVVAHSAVIHQPSPPSIDGIECAEKYAVLHWHSTGVLADISHFSIEYSTTFSPDEWEWRSEVPFVESSCILYLSPWVNYTFRVIAHNAVGASKPSEPSGACSTQPDVPYRNPLNVKAEGTRPDNMVISWAIMPQIEHHGPGFFYKVSYKRDTEGEPWTEQVLTDWRQSELVVPNTPTFKRYLIKVAAGNSRGHSREAPVVVVGWSGEDAPMLAPTNFNLTEILDGKLALAEWNPVPLESVRGHLLGYKIQVWTNDTEIKEAKVNPDSHTALINILKPFTMNYVRIMAYNGYASGPPSVTISVLTPEGTPGPVKSFNAYPLGNTAFMLRWDKPEEENGILVSYIVEYQKVIGTDVGPMLRRWTNIDPRFNEAKLSNLEPNTKYRIWISAETEAGEGRGFALEQTTNLERPSEPDAPHFEAMMLSNDTGNLLVRWRPALAGHPGTDFQVSYRPKGHSQWTQTPMEFYEVYVVIRDLQPRVYEVKVTSYDGEYSKDSEVGDVTVSFNAQRDTGNWVKTPLEILNTTFRASAGIATRSHQSNLNP